MSTPSRTRRAVLLFTMATGLVAGGLVAGGGTAAAEEPEDVLSHFLCYRATFPTFTPVSAMVVEDQFTLANATARIPKLFCNPARKTRGTVVTKIVDRNQHLKSYSLQTVQTFPGTREVLDSNQFGTDQLLQIKRAPNRILLPTKKAPHDAPVGLDHFLCYEVVAGTSIDRRVQLKDQFRSIRTKVGKPRLHCNPTVKTRLGEPQVPILHPTAHLLCYAIQSRPLDPPITRQTKNQFERGRVKSLSAEMLCVPSTKKLP